MIVSPPRLIGTRSVSRLFGVAPVVVWEHVAAGDRPYMRGYLGKISGRHTWNAHELIASLFTNDAAIELVVDRLADPDPSDPVAGVLCAVSDCDEVEEMVGLCRLHLHRLFDAWRRAPRSSLVAIQLVAMCQWVVERNEHLVLDAGYDPWNCECMTPGCTNATNDSNWHGPLCGRCSDLFWGNTPRRPRPKHWKRTRVERGLDAPTDGGR